MRKLALLAAVAVLVSACERLPTSSSERDVRQSAAASHDATADSSNNRGGIFAGSGN